MSSDIFLSTYGVYNSFRLKLYTHVYEYSSLSYSKEFTNFGENNSRKSLYNYFTSLIFFHLLNSLNPKQDLISSPASGGKCAHISAPEDPFCFFSFSMFRPCYCLFLLFSSGYVRRSSGGFFPSVFSARERFLSPVVTRLWLCGEVVAMVV